MWGQVVDKERCRQEDRAHAVLLQCWAHKSQTDA